MPSCHALGAGDLWALFFLLQGVFILLERRLRVARWRPALAHVWTVALLVLSSPLFIEPLPLVERRKLTVAEPAQPSSLGGPAATLAWQRLS
jgi:hypothetical protein